MEDGNALELSGGSGQDYRLKKGMTCWVEVDGIAVWIRRGGSPDGSGVIVELFPAGKEAESGPLDSAFAVTK